MEPASKLLERIRIERRQKWEEAELAKMRAKGKEPKNDKWKTRYKEPEPVDTTNWPSLPDGWCWSCVEELSELVVDCLHSTPKWTKTGIVCVRTTEFQPAYLNLTQAKYVSSKTYEQRAKRTKPIGGDILYSREGGILGVACLVPGNVPICMGQRMMLIRTSTEIDSTLIMYILNSPVILDLVKQFTTGSASPHLNVGDIKKFRIPIAPTEEQAKLKEKIIISLQRVSGLLQKFECSISNLKSLDQSILAKAFRGELVPQDPNDEPASLLLERIKAERALQKPKRSRKKAKKKGVA